MQTYTESIRRNVTSADEYHGDVTVRRYWENGSFLRADVFKGGWRQTTVKTENGIRRAIARLS